MAQPLHFDAINPFTGKPFTWDDPNLRFINGIGMYLEPSDPDFTPYPSVTQTPQKTKRMKHNAYYPSRVAEQLLWLENFRNKISGYAVTLGLDPATVTSIIADCRWLIHLLGSWLPAGRAWGLSCTDSATEAQSGTGLAAQVLPVFTPPALPAGVVAVKPGALNRVFDLIQTIKNSAGRTDTIESDLGTIGSAASTPAPATFQPILTGRVNGAQVDLRWNWGGNRDHLDLLQMQVDRADGKGLVDLAYDTTPNYTDTTAFPATSTIWKYRAIYHVNGAPVGVWSETISVVVGG